MPDTRRHRSAAPSDHADFGGAALEQLRAAAADLMWLAAHGYPETASLSLVGNRFEATARQRHALARAACADEHALARRSKRVRSEALSGEHLVIDGFNVLTTIEVALGGGVVLLGCDGCMRDVAGMHGSWRKVEESRAAILLAGEFLASAGVRSTEWILDAPVSNSGRLKAMLLEMAATKVWPCTVRVERAADQALIESGALVASSDRGVLDGLARWFSLAREIVMSRIPGAWVVDLDVGLRDG